MAMEPLYSLAPGVWPATLDDDGIVLIERDGFRLIDGMLPAAIFECLAPGPRTALELHDALTGRFSLDEVDMYLAGLLRDRFLEEIDPAVPSSVHQRWRSVPAPFRAVRTVLAARPVSLVGDGTLAASVRDAFDAWGLLGQSDRTTLTVVAADTLWDTLVRGDARSPSTTPTLHVGLAHGMVHARLTLPGITACVGCLADALREAEPVVGTWTRQAPPADPRWVASACDDLARRVALWLVDDGTWADPGHMLVYPALFEPPETHPIPVGASCGCRHTPERPRRPERSVLDQAPLRRGTVPADSWRHLESFIDPVTGLFRQPCRLPAPNPAMGSVYLLQHALATPKLSAASLRVNAGARSVGKGVDNEAAYRSALLEAVERRSGLWRDSIPTTRARMADLMGEALRPADWLGFDTYQYETRFHTLHNATIHPVLRPPEPLDPDLPVSWIEGHSLLTGQPVWVLAALAFYDHPEISLGFAMADSNGCAAGASYLCAVLGGLLELIERDAVARWWYAVGRRPAIDTSMLGDGYVSMQAGIHERLGRRLTVLDLTDDLGIPVAAAISECPGAPHELALGFGCALDMGATVKSALLELTQVLSARAATTTPAPVIDDVGGFLAHEAAVCLEPLSASVPAHRPPLPTTLGALLDRLAGAGLEAIVVDQTHPRIGIPVVRAIAPGMAHMWRRLGARRMREALEATGRLNPYSIVM